MLYNIYNTYYLKVLFSKKYIFINIIYESLIKEIYNLNFLLKR